MTKAKLEEQPKGYSITNATYSMKLSYAISDNLWNSFEHSISVNIEDDTNIAKINEECWEKVITEVENKIEESQKLYRG